MEPPPQSNGEAPHLQRGVCGPASQAPYVGQKTSVWATKLTDVSVCSLRTKELLDVSERTCSCSGDANFHHREPYGLPMILRRLAAILTVFFAVVAPAAAGSITIFGMDAELTNIGLTDPSVTDGAYTFQLTLDTSGYEAPDYSLLYGTDWLTAFAIDFGTTVVTASLDAWDRLVDHNGPCHPEWMRERSERLDVSADGLHLLPLDGSTYTWSFTLDFLGDVPSDPVTSASLDMVVSGLRLKRNGTISKSYISPLGALDIGYTPPDPGDYPPPDLGEDPPSDPGGDTNPLGGEEQVPTAPEPGGVALLSLGFVAMWARSRRAQA